MMTSVEIKRSFAKPGHQRVLKLRGDAQQIFVNGEFSGGASGFWDYTMYVNPYMVVRPEGHYTKHIYVNSERIASKIGNPEDFGAGDPTGQGDAVGRKIKMEEVVEENFNELFGNVPEIEQAAEQELGMSSGSTEPEHNSYWFTSDHLGSSAFVTNGSGVAIQHLEYMAFGEVFVDQRRTGFGTPYKFNAKELDCESGYYYYSARYYDPRMARFLGVDPLAGDFPSWTPYHYVHNNPLRYIDPTGMRAEETDDWVYGASRGIYWDEKATSQSTTKEGEVYLGDGFATVSDNGLQTNYNSDGSFDHNSTGENVLKVATVTGGRINNNDNSLSKVNQALSIVGFVNSVREKMFDIAGYLKNMPNLSAYSSMATKLPGVGSVVINGIQYFEASMVNDNQARNKAALEAIANSAMVAGGPIGIGVGAGLHASLLLNPEMKPVERIEYSPNKCFTAGTLISLANGKKKPIEEIRRGDKILSVNIDKMEVEKDEVIEISRATMHRKIVVKVEGVDEIHTTRHHPLYVEGKGWAVFDKNYAEKHLELKVKSLKEGDSVYVVDDLGGRLLKRTIKTIIQTDDIVEMYTLANVKKNNNFFANGILVHNKKVK